MNIAVIGTGYVGLVAGACFAEMGNTVLCVDKDADKIERLRRGECPIYEVGLPELLAGNIQEKRLDFTTSLAEAAARCDIFFIAVGTSAPNGGSDISQVANVARDLGRVLQRPAIIVNKSTVPVGTNEKIECMLRQELQQRGIDLAVEFVANPEFLKQGAAVQDFMRPDRVIVGADTEYAREVMHELYRAFTHKTDRVIFMGRRDAEMCKYAANAMLATKISFMNEIANLCERMDVDVEAVRVGIGSDPRIGYSFIYPGCGYGGSCLPKDVKALVRMAEEVGFEAHLLAAVDTRNTLQKHRLVDRVCERFGNDLSGFTFGIWGLAYKPGTDDMREAPSKTVLRGLIMKGASAVAYDPEAMDVARCELPAEWFESGKLRLADHQYDACRDVDALILVTEWKPFRHPDFAAMKKIMRRAVIFDGRNQYEPEQMKKLGFEYFATGRSSSHRGKGTVKS